MKIQIHSLLSHCLSCSQPGLPLQDRLLGFVMGNEADLNVSQLSSCIHKQTQAFGGELVGTCGITSSCMCACIHDTPCARTQVVSEMARKNVALLGGTAQHNYLRDLDHGRLCTARLQEPLVAQSSDVVWSRRGVPLFNHAEQ